MQKYKQITNDEREIISCSHKEDLEYIGKVICKHKSSVIGEIKRNSSTGEYSFVDYIKKWT